MKQQRHFVACAGSVLLALGLSACGGQSLTPEPVLPPADQEPEVAPAAASVPRDDEEREGEQEEQVQKPVESEPKPEPEFRPGMTVNEAIAAIPQSTQRVNIEPDALAAPLMKAELYEPCAIRGNQGFKVRVAVWNGEAVGIDVATQPKNEKLDGCLREQIASVKWPDRVRSLNTVEYSY